MNRDARTGWKETEADGVEATRRRIQVATEGRGKKDGLLEDADSRSQRAESFPQTTQARQWAGADEITRGK